MIPFVTTDSSVFLKEYAMELYLPYEYLDSEYRGIPYYTIIGTNVKFFGIGNFRLFKDEKEYNNPLDVPTYPFGIPMRIVSAPSDIDTREVQFVPNGIVRKCIVLTFKKDDAVIVNREAIKQIEVMTMLLQRLENGKLDHIPPEVAIQIFNDAQIMNKLNLRIPSEELEIFVSERYRNPNDTSKKYRTYRASHTDNIVSYNMREEAMQTTTYQSITHEDINNALITSINRKNKGIVDEPTIMERIVRGLPIDDIIEDQEKESETKKQTPV